MAEIEAAEAGNVDETWAPDPSQKDLEPLPATWVMLEHARGGEALEMSVHGSIRKGPFGIFKLFGAWTMRQSLERQAPYDRFPEIAADAVRNARVSVHPTRKLTEFDFALIQEVSPSKPPLRLDFHKVSVFNIANTLLIELPEFWRVQQVDGETWVCKQPDLPPEQEWGDFEISLALSDAEPEAKRATAKALRAGHRPGFEDNWEARQEEDDVGEGDYLERYVVRLATLNDDIGILNTRLRIKRTVADQPDFRALVYQMRRAAWRAWSPHGPIYPVYAEVFRV